MAGVRAPSRAPPLALAHSILYGFMERETEERRGEERRGEERRGEERRGEERRGRGEERRGEERIKPMPKCILIVDDDQLTVELAKKTFQGKDYES